MRRRGAVLGDRRRRVGCQVPTHGAHSGRHPYDVVGTLTFMPGVLPLRGCVRVVGAVPPGAEGTWPTTTQGCPPAVMAPPTPRPRKPAPHSHPEENRTT